MSRTTWPARIALVVMLFFTVLSAAGNTGPEPPSPLVPIDGDVVEIINYTPLASDGSERQVGLVSVQVRGEFNSGRLTDLSPGVELILEGDPGWNDLRILTVRVPDQEVYSFAEAAAELPDVVSASPNYMARIDTADPYWPAQQFEGLVLVDLERTWPISRTKNVVVAVVDTGVNNVSELAGSLLPGKNFADGDPNDASDPNGHGTSVAAVIAATKDNGIAISGVAPAVKILPVRACIENGNCPPLWTANALSWLAGQVAAGDVDVINLSWSTSGTIDAHKDSLDAIRELGGTVVAASGNDGSATVGWPARYDKVIGVGGVTRDGARHASSNYGSNLDVAAPYNTFSVDGSGMVYAVGGTSFATPVIAGVMALARGTMLTPRMSGQGQMFNNAMWTEHGAGWDAETGYGVPQLYNWFWDRSCVVFDFNADEETDVVDAQMISYRYGSFTGRPLYAEQFDLHPPYYDRDGDIDIADLQKLYGRIDRGCYKPEP